MATAPDRRPGNLPPAQQQISRDRMLETGTAPLEAFVPCDEWLRFHSTGAEGICQCPVHPSVEFRRTPPAHGTTDGERQRVGGVPIAMQNGASSSPAPDNRDIRPMVAADIGKRAEIPQGNRLPFPGIESENRLQLIEQKRLIHCHVLGGRALSVCKQPYGR